MDQQLFKKLKKINESEAKPGSIISYYPHGHPPEPNEQYGVVVNSTGDKCTVKFVTGEKTIESRDITGVHEPSEIQEEIEWMEKQLEGLRFVVGKAE